MGLPTSLKMIFQQSILLNVIKVDTWTWPDFQVHHTIQFAMGVTTQVDRLNQASPPAMPRQGAEDC